MKQGKLTLVGAGPGDPDLISVKGVKAIRRADVVLYDALTHPDLLDYARSGVRCLSVGKRAGRHSFKQEDINDLIVEYAGKYGHVVRLKGGDPFVFARGQEEIEHARLHGLETEVIIGVSSVNLGGMYDIPLTKRGVNESFWVVTATTASGKLSNDVHLVAQSSATGVFLMGLRKIDKITAAYARYGKHHLPVAVISNGSLSNAEVVVGTISDIEEKVREGKVQTPAIFIAGEVVKNHSPGVLVSQLTQKQPAYV